MPIILPKFKDFIVQTFWLPEELYGGALSIKFLY